jgi:hypothetical protein
MIVDASRSQNTENHRKKEKTTWWRSSRRRGAVTSDGYAPIVSAKRLSK